MPRNLFAAEKVFGAISEATSSPIAQYISSPTTFLHSVDPRIKMVFPLFIFGSNFQEFGLVGRNCKVLAFLDPVDKLSDFCFIVCHSKVSLGDVCDIYFGLTWS